MSIGSINNTGNTPFAENISPNREKTPDATGTSALSQLTDQAGLSALVPRLQNILKAIDHPEDNVLQALSNNISSLQDAFVDEVFVSLDSQGIDLSEKITLRLDADDKLKLSNQHPDQTSIEEALAKKPELSEAFREIATQSELLRDVSNVGKVIGAHSGAAGYQNMYDQAKADSYQISMKGEMSHFYFTK